MDTSIRNRDCTIRNMHVNKLNSEIITDGIATITENQINNLVEPTEPDQIATKNYVDNSGGSGGGASGPNYAIQVNNGGFSGSADFIVSDPDLSTSAMNVKKMNINMQLLLNNGIISGINTPINNTDAANKLYVDNKQDSYTTTTENIVFNEITYFTPSDVYNNIVDLTVIPYNLFGLFPGASILPPASDMQTYLGDGFTIGASWTTIIRLPKMEYELFFRIISGKSLDDNTHDTGVFFYPYSEFLILFEMAFAFNHESVKLLSIVINTSPPQYQVCVTDQYNDIPITNARVTNKGLLTESYINHKQVSLGDYINIYYNDDPVILDNHGRGTILYPIPEDPIINSEDPIMYTHEILKGFLIIRTGLIQDTIDTFDPNIPYSNDFSMGGGTYRFFISNRSNYKITLSLPGNITSIHTLEIPSEHCGAYWLNVDTSTNTCILRCIGLNPLVI